MLRDCLAVTRGVDPVALENDRMTHMSIGFTPPVGQLTVQGQVGFLYSVAYVSFQELATRISHRNTAAVCDDPVADRMLRRVALDEASAREAART